MEEPISDSIAVCSFAQEPLASEHMQLRTVLLLVRAVVVALSALGKALSKGGGPSLLYGN